MAQRPERKSGPALFCLLRFLQSGLANSFRDCFPVSVRHSPLLWTSTVTAIAVQSIDCFADAAYLVLYCVRFLYQLLLFVSKCSQNVHCYPPVEFYNYCFYLSANLRAKVATITISRLFMRAKA